jgi:hypothetical protein
MKSSSKRLLLVHIAGCILFLSLPVLSSPDSSSASFGWLLRHPPTQRDLAAYGLLVLTFYANFFFFAPQFYFNKKYVYFILLNLLCLVLIVGLPGILIPEHAGGPAGFSPTHGGPPPRGEPSWLNRISRHLFLFLMVVFFSLMLHISDRWKRAEKEKLGTQLAFLRAQINPHFLFNTLNSIYALALEKSDQAPTAVVKLSGMMRYVLNDTGKDFVSLQEEITYVRDYIALQEIRFGEGIKLEFAVNGSAIGKRIAPLVLIPFIENAFKYGINAEEAAFIAIHIEIGEQQLHLQVFNKKVKVQLLPDQRSGLGIENTRARLQLLYPGTHTLSITDTAVDFTVHLSIQLI